MFQYTIFTFGVTLCESSYNSQCFKINNTEHSNKVVSFSLQQYPLRLLIEDYEVLSKHNFIILNVEPGLQGVRTTNVSAQLPVPVIDND